MTRKPITTVSVATTREAEDAVSVLMEQEFSEPAVSYADAETGAVIVTVYLSKPPPDLAAKRVSLRSGISILKSLGLDTGTGRISIRRLKQENWAESWKLHFKTIEVGRRLLVKPSWSKARAKPGQAVVTLDPGLSFGTGQHPTTAFCLGELVRRRRAGERQSFLDIGTGSGIVAIAAAKLGYSPVYAFDFDPVAVKVARSNARLNGVLSGVKITLADLTKLPRRKGHPFDFVAANLISTLQMAEAERIAARVAPAGFLVLAGILDAEFEQVRGTFESRGFRLLASASRQGWRSGTFCRVK